MFLLTTPQKCFLFDFFLNGNVFSETRIGVREKFALGQKRCQTFFLQPGRRKGFRGQNSQRKKLAKKATILGHVIRFHLEMIEF